LEIQGSIKKGDSEEGGPRTDKPGGIRSLGQPKSD